MTDEIRDNTTASRFELDVDGQIVFALYRRDGDVVAIRHVETPYKLRGHGAAGRLMAAIVARARAEHLRITPLCSYASSWLREHPEHHDLLA